MKPEFRQQITKIKAGSEGPLPLIPFSSETRTLLSESVEVLDHIEGMAILLESHPFLPFTDAFSFGSDVLNYRRAMAYEVVLRLVGHCRSFAANLNIRNHIGTAVALRCMLELYAFVVYLHDGRTSDLGILDKLLHGSMFYKGEWYEYEKVWKEKHGEALPEKIKEILKLLLKTPRVGEYRNALKVSDEGFEYMYSIYSQFVHPAFRRPREQFMEDAGYEPVGLVGKDSEYYQLARRSPSPTASLKRDANVTSFCLELTWPRLLEIDPLFDDDYRPQVLARLKATGVLKDLNI